MGSLISIDQSTEHRQENSLFLSHNWGVDNYNHDNVIKINKGLRDLGYTTWIDAEHMSGDTLQSMSDGIDQCKIVLVFVNHEYMTKVNDPGTQACKFEFNYAVRRKTPAMMLPIVIRTRTEQPIASRDWFGPVGLVLSSHLYAEVDCSTGGPIDISNIIRELNKMSVEQIDIPPAPVDPYPEITVPTVEELVTLGLITLPNYSISTWGPSGCRKTDAANKITHEIARTTHVIRRQSDLDRIVYGMSPAEFTKLKQRGRQLKIDKHMKDMAIKERASENAAVRPNGGKPGAWGVVGPQQLKSAIEIELYDPGSFEFGMVTPYRTEVTNIWPSLKSVPDVDIKWGVPIKLTDLISILIAQPLRAFAHEDYPHKQAGLFGYERTGMRNIAGKCEHVCTLISSQDVLEKIISDYPTKGLPINPPPRVCGSEQDAIDLLHKRFQCVFNSFVSRGVVNRVTYLVWHTISDHDREILKDNLKDLQTTYCAAATAKYKIRKQEEKEQKERDRILFLSTRG
jgi:hypothetical protein